MNIKKQNIKFLFNLAYRMGNCNCLGVNGLDQHVGHIVKLEQ